MLWTYAPLETMDRTSLPRGLCGTGSRGLQMDRLRWGDPFFRSAGARRLEDLYGDECERRPVQPPERRSAERGRPEVDFRGTELQPVCNHLAVPRPDIFRRRTHRRASRPGPQPQGGSGHHLAPERQTTRRSGTDHHAIRPAAPGSRHLRDRRDHHRSEDRRIHEHGQRQLFRSAAFRTRSPAPEALALQFRQPDARFGR
jgi:hypothetical protein